MFVSCIFKLLNKTFSKLKKMKCTNVYIIKKVILNLRKFLGRHAFIPFRAPRTMFLASRTFFRPRAKRSPLPLKFSDTRRRILFRVGLYKFICKETWYRGPNISTATKYQKTVRNLYVSDSYSLRKRNI